MSNKNWVLELIVGAHREGYISLRNDLIYDIKNQLSKKEFDFILRLVGEK